MRPLTHGNERYTLTLLILGDAGGARIKGRMSVHEEPVLVVAVGQFNLDEPPAIQRSLHGYGAPMVEIAHEVNVLGGGSCAKEIHGVMNASFGRQMAFGPWLVSHIHRSINMVWCYTPVT